LLLSVKFSEALRLPVADGVNATVTAHQLSGVTVAPVQESKLLAKSLAFVPLIVAVEMMRLAMPLLYKTSVWAGPVVPTGQLPKVKGFWLGAAWGTAPIPLKVTVCSAKIVDPLLLSSMVRVPLTVPAAVGEKDTLTVQEPSTATYAWQVLAVTLKLALMAMLVMLSGELDVLVKVTG
jgi:hypothetical protein